MDKDFLRKVALFTTEDFDSNGSHKLCMEHFSPDASPSEIKECDELVRCLRGLLLTYDELWDVGWKKSLETTFVDFLENFERRKSIRLDWHYASRVVLSFFHHLQEAAQQPRVGISMVGQDTPRQSEEWVPFMRSSRSVKGTFQRICCGRGVTRSLGSLSNSSVKQCTSIVRAQGRGPEEVQVEGVLPPRHHLPPVRRQRMQGGSRHR